MVAKQSPETVSGVSAVGPARTAAGSNPTSHILIACMPKSGSTFLLDVIRKLPGFRKALLIPDMGRREQELDEACLQAVDGFNYVAQQHVRYNEWTAQLCGAYRLKPVVLVRSLLDVVVSLRDHLRRETHVWPIFFAEPHHAKLDDQALEAMIARLALPWYLNFYMGWRTAPDTLMIDYEELTTAPTKVVEDILRHAGAHTSRPVIQASVDRIIAVGESRMNVGVAGRGSGLHPDTIRGVLELLDFYPSAADDPYFRAIREQAHAALAGEAPSIVAPPRATPSLGWLPLAWPRKTRRTIIRWSAPPLLLLAAAFYWVWPRDLIPDSQAFGLFDDCLVLLGLAYLAGRLSMLR